MLQQIIQQTGQEKKAIITQEIPITGYPLPDFTGE